MPWKGPVVVTEEEDSDFEDGSTKIVNEFQFTSPAVIYWPLRKTVYYMFQMMKERHVLSLPLGNSQSYYINKVLHDTFGRVC